jgi:L-ascorbate metabolism protein UlaG (beta-lactamase superfamily)
MSHSHRAPRAAAVLLALALAPGAAVAGQLRVDALGGAGFLVSGEGRAVLFDGLVAVPPTTVPSCKRVALAVASHSRSEAFDAGAVAAFLGRTRAAVFVSTPPAAAVLRTAPGATEAVLKRVVAVAALPGEQRAVPGTPVVVTAFVLAPRADGVVAGDHLAFLVDLDGAILLHLGRADVTPAELAGYDFDRAGVTVAFVPFWLLDDPGEVAALQGVVGRATTFVATWLPPADDGDRERLVHTLQAAGVLVIEPGDDLRLAFTARQ